MPIYLAGHSVSLYYSSGNCCIFGVVPAASGGTIQGHALGAAYIDQIGGPWFDFNLGHLAIYDDSNFDNLLTQTPLVGYSQLTSFVVQGTGPSALKSGTVAILPTPEPVSVALSFTGFACLWLNRSTESYRSLK